MSYHYSSCTMPMHALSCYRYRKKGEEESENEDSSSDESEASIRDEVDAAASNV